VSVIDASRAASAARRVLSIGAAARASAGTA
jgi:hypothetical protein